ncbi:uncharacterized protein B0I36DRAFT_24575 [Microdochium trichocladiopsis]|uniref:Uncharacterized protein n=1 Tax=Microdochium trichocladiopsis TaxID=1682393 RepID=A0A9P9BWM5_9PEZI|nr:uncharacterized protein B0I36DRAFT_24575 [Microdochium trichocladiopsis]KAH7041578.1 hypothetical protein B0I36DRAFT_24575 [Microdochium trichocladiopsis]
MSESGGSDAGVDTSSVSDSLYSRTGPADIHISSHDEGEQDETVIEASEEEDEDEDEDEEESSESGSNQDGRASGSEAGYTDLDDDLFNEVDFDTGFEDPDDFGPFYDSDFDAEAWRFITRWPRHHIPAMTFYLLQRMYA